MAPLIDPKSLVPRLSIPRPGLVKMKGLGIPTNVDLIGKSGNNELIGQSGNEELIGGSGKQSLMGPTLMPNLRPKVDALNYLLENRAINKIKDTQLARKNLYYNAPSLSVRPVTDVPSEILAAQEDALSQIRSEYNGSDPVMNMLGKNIAAAQRNKMRNEQITGRAAQLLQDRSRFDDQQRLNQQAAAETANKNLDREQDFADYRTGANTSAMEAKKALNASFLSQIGMNIDTAAEYNQTRDAYELQKRRQEYEDAIKLAALESDEGKREVLLMDAKEKWAPYAAQKIPTFSEAQRGAWRPRLSPRFANLRQKR